MSEMILTNTGVQEWREDGELHRLDGPAVIYPDGGEGWYRNGYIHRENGPAYTCTSGEKRWYRWGELHRLDGPALTCPYAPQCWIINGLVQSFVLVSEDIIHIGEPIDISCYPSLTLLEDHEYDSMYRIGKEDLCLLRLEHRVVATFKEE